MPSSDSKSTGTQLRFGRRNVLKAATKIANGSPDARDDKHFALHVTGPYWLVGALITHIERACKEERIARQTQNGIRKICRRCARFAFRPARE